MLDAAVGTLSLLPIGIDTNLPHVVTLIGKEPMGFEISAAYDTCTAVTIGYSQFHLAIAKKYPHLVKSLTWAKGVYSLLHLPGIVKKGYGDGTPTETDLPSVIENHIPLKIHDSNTASFKVAISEGVSENTIIGFSFIKDAKLTLDLEDSVIDPVAFITLPFPTEYKITSRSLPQFKIEQSDGIPTFNNITQSAEILTILQNIEAYKTECFPNVEY